MSYVCPIELYQCTPGPVALQFNYDVWVDSGDVCYRLALTRIGWRHYNVFCVLLGFMTVLVYSLFLETKGRTPEEIAEIFEGSAGRTSEDTLKSETIHKEYVGSKEDKGGMV